MPFVRITLLNKHFIFFLAVCLDQGFSNISGLRSHFKIEFSMQPH